MPTPIVRVLAGRVMASRFMQPFSAYRSGVLGLTQGGIEFQRPRSDRLDGARLARRRRFGNALGARRRSN
jgi:hypothetical protein